MSDPTVPTMLEVLAVLGIWLCGALLVGSCIVWWNKGQVKTEDVLGPAIWWPLAVVVYGGIGVGVFLRWVTFRIGMVMLGLERRVNGGGE